MQMGIFIEDRVIRILRIWATYYTVWPLRSEDGKFKAVLCKFLWWFYTVNILHCIPLMINSVFYQESILDILKCMMETVYVCEISFDLIYCGIRRKQLQKLLYEIEQTEDKIWKPHEQAEKGKFMRRLHKICIPLPIITLIEIVLYIFSPLIITNRMYLLNVVYPFPVTNSWVYCLTYIHNAITAQQALIIINFHLIITVIMWHASLKFYLLGMQIRFADSAEKLRTSIIEYQDIISYVREINCVFKIVIFKSVIITFIHMIISGLLVLNNAPPVEILEYFINAFISMCRLFICCWAAEEITVNAYNITWQIYNSPCMYGSPNVRQNVYMFIQRCQKPIVISASSFIPEFSVRFYGKLIYTTFSFFTALRAAL